MLDRTEQTTADGIYNLWFEHSGWAQLGRDRRSRTRPRRPQDHGHCARPNLGSVTALRGAASTTPPQPTPDSTLATSRSPLRQGDARPGVSTATPTPGRSTFHGLGSTRAGASAASLAATELDYTSLVVSYRNTAEGPRVGTGRSTLGDAEMADVDEAIGYAVRRGAQQIVLFGWSMGAAIALQLTDRPRTDGLIAALVLDSPVLNWSRSHQTNCVRSGLQQPGTSRSRGSPSPEWRAQLVCPTASCPLLRLDILSRRPRDADPAPPGQPRRLCADPAHRHSETPARTSSRWRPSTPPYPLLEHRPRPVAEGSDDVALGPTRPALTTTPAKPNSNGTSPVGLRLLACLAIERGRTNVAEPWLSADDIAAHLGITKDTVYTWIAEKAMPAHKVGRLWKFQASEVDDWVRNGHALHRRATSDARGSASCELYRLAGLRRKTYERLEIDPLRTACVPREDVLQGGLADNHFAAARQGCCVTPSTTRCTATPRPSSLRPTRPPG